jgi:hypothetical protein
MVEPQVRITERQPDVDESCCGSAAALDPGQWQPKGLSEPDKTGGIDLVLLSALYRSLRVLLRDMYWKLSMKACRT